MNRLDRLTAILIQLQTKRVVKAEEIAERFEISVRTVYRDVRSLMEAGVPIGSEAGKGYFIVDGFHLPPVMFSQDEASAILLAGKLVEKMTDVSVRKAFESALMKIKAVLSEVEKDHLESLESYVQVFQMPRAEQTFPNHFLTDIQKALVNQEVLEVEYHSTRENQTKREVDPVGMCFYSGAWHLIAWCKLRQDYRDFRADRILNLVNTGKKYDRRNLLSLQDYLKSFVQTHNGVEKVVILFDKNVALHRNTIFGFVSQEEVGDKLRMTFLADNLDWMARWLIVYGRAVAIEQPEKLKTLMRDLVEDLSSHYLKDYATANIS